MIVKELFARLGLDFDGGGFTIAEAAIGGLKGGLEAVGVALAGMAAGLATAIKATADTGAAATRLAQRTGVSVESIQALGYAADFSGSSADDLAIALNHLAHTGVRDVEGTFRKLADQFARMPDGGRKTEIAIDKLGRAGGALIPLLNKGTAGLDALKQEARELGVIMSKETAQAGAEMNHALERVNKALVGVRNEAVGPLLPYVERLADRMKNWIVINRALIQQRLAQAIRIVIFAAKELWRTLSLLVKVVNSAIYWFKLFAFVLGSTVAAALLLSIDQLAIITAYYVAAGAAAVAAGFEAAAAWVAAALPLAALAALILLVALAAEDVYVALQGGDSLIGELGPKWTAFLDSWFKNDQGDGWLMTAIKAVIFLFSDLGQNVGDSFAEWGNIFKRFGAWVVDSFNSIGQSLDHFFKGLADKLVATIRAPLDWLSDKARALDRGLGGLIHGYTYDENGKRTDNVPAPDASQGDGSGSMLMGFSEDPTARFGGGATPAASAASSVNTSRSVTVAPNLNVGGVVIQSNGDPDQIAGALTNKLDEWQEKQNRETLAAVGG